MCTHFLRNQLLDTLTELVRPHDPDQNQFVEGGEVCPFTWHLSLKNVLSIVHGRPILYHFPQIFIEPFESWNRFRQLAYAAPSFVGKPRCVGWYLFISFCPCATNHHKSDFVACYFSLALQHLHTHQKRKDEFVFLEQTSANRFIK